MTIVNDVQAELAAAWADLEKAQQRLKEVRRRVPSEPVQDYQLRGPDGPISLAELFGDKSDLILIHNMGTGCPYCTMWADGFNGVIHHLEDRSAFVVVSPDSVETQQEFRSNRGWRFRMYSAADTSLFKDMGFESEDEHYGSNAMPGVSVFHKATTAQSCASPPTSSDPATPTAASGTSSTCSATASATGKPSSTIPRSSRTVRRRGHEPVATAPIIAAGSLTPEQRCVY